MLGALFDALLPPKTAWTLLYSDTFARESYPMAGRYRTRERALKAARRELRRIEKAQPTHSSGIQDRIYIVSPDLKPELVKPR
jgi:hypothetical protein